ncbi:MAG: carboxypeptidase regulatory-like domain-containing protein [Thermoplasmata archaeon]
MESTSSGWWHRHGWTVAILLSAFGTAFAIRTVWTYPVVSQWGSLFTYAGGSDSYYHSRVMTWIIQNHTNLVWDPMLNYPTGGINPREPLFDWMNAILGIVFAPFFGGNAVTAGSWFLDLQAPLWAALGVFPVYLIGREVASRRTGLIAAMIFPFLSANIDSSIFGYANYLSFYTFMVLVVVYSYIRTVKAVGSHRWVADYRHPRQYLPALLAFLRGERTAVKWAVFTGVALGALALTWQGYTYAVVVIAVALVVAMVIERIRRVDSFGLYVATAIVGIVGFPMAMPYYLVQRQFTTWFDLPLLIFFGALALLLPFLLMRDVPWVFSIPFLVAVVAAGVGVLAFVSPATFSNLVTGQGYFVKTLIYSTVAEAQAPSIDQLVIGYGVVTFFLAFAGFAIFVYLLVKGRFKRHHIVFLVFAVLSIYLPISAAKFFLIGSPIFALLPAEAIRRALDIGGYGELRRTAASLADRRSQFSAFRKAFKPRHVLVMALVLLIILPNVWVAIDAGIPGNTKASYASQVGASLPPWLQLNTSNPSSYYFGAAGTSLDTPNQYDSAGYNWLAQQDTNIPEPQRPALVSWWDYGFQTIDEGLHPSVANNFQQGIDPSGQFLLSQNESQAIAVLTTTLLQGEQRASGTLDLPVALNQILATDGVNVNELHNLLVNTSKDYALVVAHPERYLPVDSTTLTYDNAMYLAMAYFLATSLSLSGVAKVYDDVQAYTGWTVRYAMVDSRLFPFSGTDTGIFYAPADLTGRVIDSAGMPETFFNLSVLGSDGSYYPYGNLPSGVTAVGSPVVNYYAPFYDSMIYRIYIGYNGTDIGQSAGIPGLTMNSTIEPGWMLQHFEVVYKTAYVCSQPSYAGSCAATNQPAAVSDASRINGSADLRAYSYFSGGETMLEYYPGQTLLGDVQLPDGSPVGGARVTVYDGWGIPHQTAVTAPDGSFSLVLPPGNDTVNVTLGLLQGLSQAGDLLLKSMTIDVPDATGLSFNAPNLVQTVTVGAGSIQGFVYWKNGNTTSYTPPGDTLVPGAQVVFWGPNLTRYVATTDASGAFDITNVAPGLYHYDVLYAGQNYSQNSVTVTPGVGENATAGLQPASVTGSVSDSLGHAVSGATVTLGGPTGVLSTYTTNTTGTYTLGSVGPGNYTVRAVVPGSDLRSAGVPITFASGTTNLSVNLTVLPSGSVTVVLTANGGLAAGVPVRFTPIATYANASVSPLAALSEASGNATVIVSSGAGSVTAVLPAGDYSVYASGLIDGQTYVGLGTTSVVAGVVAASSPLPLSPALRLSGSVAPAGPQGTSTRTAVIAYSSGGDELVAWTTRGSYALSLPAGTYSLLALEGPTDDASSVSAGLVGVTLSTSTSVSISPVTALRAEFTVGAPVSGGSLYPAAGAAVSVSAGASGPAIPTVASSNGSAALYVPSVLPLSAGSYCVRSAAFGFASTATCDLSPTGLAALTQVPTSLDPVSVTVDVLGLPSGTSVQVNFTAESSTAVNASLSGGPTFSLSLPPGLYGVGARAVIGSGTVVYLPAGPLSTTIPVGATSSALTLIVIPQVNATGVLSLPSAIPAASVTVSLSSPVFNVSVNGAVFESVFRAAPGTYSAYATATLGGTTYASLSRVTVAPDGTISPSIVLSGVGPTLSGTLVNPSGTTLLLNATVHLVNPDGASAVTNAVNGTFSLPLGPNTTYAAFVNGTTTVAGANGSYVQSWSAVAGASCSVAAVNASCSIPLSGVPQSVWLNGTLTVPGVSGPVPGTVRLVGPYPSTNATVLTTSTGAFSTPLVPGAYSLYATGSGSAQTLAALTTVLALPSTTLEPLSVTLTPTWVDTISLVPPNGTVSGLGPVTVTVASALGTRAVYADQAWGSPLVLALPVGTYVVQAQSVGTLGGVATNASAQTSVTVLNGNVGTVLSLAYASQVKVAGTLVGPASATVTAGGSATFSFSVRNSGNVPVTVHPVGTPSYWTFDFSLGNLTLLPGPAGTVVSGEVRVQVPAGTLVEHPSMTIEFATANGTVVGSVSPAPTVNVVGYYGVAAGPSGLPVRVGLDTAEIPFYITNTGNVAETVVATISDSARLEGLGWTSNLTSGATPGQVVKSLAAGDNVSLDVNLTATSSVFVPPGTVTITLSVLESSGSVSATTTLSVPIAAVSARSTSGVPPVTVTGPSLGSAPNLPPDWLVPLLSFVPAIALVVGILTYRWWRRRRWTRR